jgi:hypothetical protein
MTTSIAELQTAGLRFESFEAVAIAQQLIDALRGSDEADEAQAPYGPPSTENVFLCDDGAVLCRGCRTTPAVSEIGIFLDALLSTGPGRVPGGLRYTIARALLNVDVPPFDSLDDLSRDLSRHEHGDRAVIIRRALARAGRHGAITPIPSGGGKSSADPTVDRRKNRASTTTLRRELREADARLYQQREGMNRATPRVIDLVPVVPPPPSPRGRTLSAAAVCLAAGLSLIAAGELMHKHQNAIAQVDEMSQAAPATMQTAVADEPRVEPAPALATMVPLRVADVAAGPGLIYVRDTPSRSVRSSRSVNRPEARRVAVKRAPRSTVVNARRQGGSRSRGVLDRLKLGWLRTAFTAHSEF